MESRRCHHLRFCIDRIHGSLVPCGIGNNRIQILRVNNAVFIEIICVVFVHLDRRQMTAQSKRTCAKIGYIRGNGYTARQAACLKCVITNLL